MKKIYDIFYEFLYSYLQMARFFRYHLFPVYCPDCEYQLSIMYSKCAEEIKTKNVEEFILIENKLKKELSGFFKNGEKIRCDYLYCQNCTYAKNLDLEMIEEE